MRICRSQVTRSNDYGTAMRELLELRLYEHAAAHVVADKGVRISPHMRKLEIDLSDPLIERLRKAAAHLRSEGKSLFAGWDIRRSYSAQEFARAEVFQLIIRAKIPESAEPDRTEYDSSQACVTCGAGRRQVGPLVLDVRRLPQSRDILATLDGQWIVSQKLGELLVQSSFTGFSLLRVRHSADHSRESIRLSAVPSGRELLSRAAKEQRTLLADDSSFWRWAQLPEQRPLLAAAEQETIVVAKHRDEYATVPRSWYQLIPEGTGLEVDQQQTRFGIDPFDLDDAGQFRCTACGVLGLNILSELSIQGKNWTGLDFARTRQLIGLRMGRFVPQPLYVISSRMRQLIVKERMQKVGFEVAHLTRL